jgi:hypothetical protein
VSNESRNKIRNKKKMNFARPAAATATPANPKMPAMIATIRNINAQFNMADLSLEQRANASRGHRAFECPHRPDFETGDSVRSRSYLLLDHAPPLLSRFHNPGPRRRSGLGREEEASQGSATEPHQIIRALV